MITLKRTPCEDGLTWIKGARGVFAVAYDGARWEVLRHDPRDASSLVQVAAFPSDLGAVEFAKQCAAGGLRHD